MEVTSAVIAFLLVKIALIQPPAPPVQPLAITFTSSIKHAYPNVKLGTSPTLTTPVCNANFNALYALPSLFAPNVELNTSYSTTCV